ILDALVSAWRTTYPQFDDRDFVPAARNHVKWLIRGVLDTVPLAGNRTAGVRLINTCLEHGATADAYTRSEMYTAAARALALLGERDEAGNLLGRILTSADQTLGNDDLLLYEVLEQVTY